MKKPKQKPTRIKIDLKLYLDESKTYVPHLCVGLEAAIGAYLKSLPNAHGEIEWGIEQTIDNCCIIPQGWVPTESEIKEVANRN